MADARLRELARRESDLETEVRLLREHVRQRDLAEERVRLAAMLGSQAAGLAMDALVAVSPSEILDALAASSRPVHVHGLVAIARSVLPFWEDVWAGNGVGWELRSALQSAELMLDCPCDEHRLELHCSALDAVRATHFQPESREDFCAKEVVTQAAGAVFMLKASGQGTGHSDFYPFERHACLARQRIEDAFLDSVPRFLGGSFLVWLLSPRGLPVRVAR